jgi:hypothetical protein
MAFHVRNLVHVNQKVSLAHLLIKATDSLNQTEHFSEVSAFN